MQIQTMDQIMDAWEEQIKSPNPSLPILSKLKSFPSLSPVDAWSSATLLGLGAIVLVFAGLYFVRSILAFVVFAHAPAGAVF